jgi:LPS export ABC transporter protein LptC
VLSETDQGRMEWKLYARSAATFQARNTVWPTACEWTSIDQQGKRSSTLTARRGELNQVQRDMLASGNVVLQTAKAHGCRPIHLNFINKTQRIVTDAFVRVEQQAATC